jgi:oligopeptide transport system ATP-binding protein
MTDQEILLEVRELAKYFPVRKGFAGHKVADIKAIDGISFAVNKREILGLAGESGCGKTTAALCILQLRKPTAGEVCYKGVDLVTLKPEKMRSLRRELQLISATAQNSLNPRMRIGDIIAEPLLVHKLAGAEESKARVADLLSLVQIDPEMADNFPHEFNLDQRLRIEIARSMSLRPNFVICDDPGLDLGPEAQTRIIHLLKWFQSWLNLTYLFIAQDLGMARQICDRVMVMYAGKIMEVAVTEELFQNPLHPYTRTWLSTVQTSQGSVAWPAPPVASNGCRFYHRCGSALPICDNQDPELIDNGRGHFVACHRNS